MTATAFDRGTARAIAARRDAMRDLEQLIADLERGDDQARRVDLAMARAQLERYRSLEQ